MVRATKPVTLHEHDDEALFCGCCICNLRSSKAEVEKIDRKMKAHREIAVAAIAGSEKQIHKLQAALTAALEQNERFATELTKLRALIDKHNDECRECPVIEA